MSSGVLFNSQDGVGVFFQAPKTMLSMQQAKGSLDKALLPCKEEASCVSLQTIINTCSTIRSGPVRKTLKKIRLQTRAYEEKILLSPICTSTRLGTGVFRSSFRCRSTGTVYTKTVLKVCRGWLGPLRTHNLDAPLPAPDASTVYLTHSIRSIAIIGEPDEREARRVASDPDLF